MTLTIKNRTTLLWSLLLLSTFLASFLFFLVQPIFTKLILPSLGGSAMVWSTVNLFFQITLLTGYGYILFLGKKNFFTKVHIHLLLSCLILLYVFVSPSLVSQVFHFEGILRAVSVSPFSTVLLLSFMVIGIPSFLLATNSTLMQQLADQLDAKKNPYKLYIYSNLGSLLGLLLYPFVLEPLFSLSAIALMWKVGVLLAIVFIILALLFSRAIRTEKYVAKKIPKPLQKKQFLQWGIYAALPVALLMAVTNQITIGIAPIPLLWIVPLALYLVSFMYAFSDTRVLRGWYGAFWVSLVSVVALLLVPDYTIVMYGIKTIVLVFLTFCGSYLIHAFLYSSRPPATQLSYFYLALAAGGVLGGSFVSLLSPLLFTTYWELPLTILGCGLIILTFQGVHRLGKYITLEKPEFAIILIALTVTYLGKTVFLERNQNSIHYRNFYGTITITESGGIKNLLNGSIVHGQQSLDPAQQWTPTTYYGEKSGVGRALRVLNQKTELAGGNQVGVIGLGVGTLAAYCREQDEYDFFEINPQVVQVAENNFSYLENCPNHQILLGDARISLAESERSADEKFSLLVVDAFTDDSIPTHLLTLEAFQLYLNNLQNDGVLAFHISNKFLHLSPVIYSAAELYDLSAVEIRYTPGADEKMATPSLWILVTRNQTFLAEPTIVEAVTQDAVKNTHTVWTDDFSNILTLLKLK